MAFPLQNPFNMQQLASPLSREILESDQYTSPSGQTVDIQLIRETGEDPGGKSYSRQYKRVVPGLADGKVPESSRDIRECARCLSLIHVTSSCDCPGCNFTFCRVCAPEVERDEKTVRLCVNCAEKSDPSLLKAAKRLIWGK